MVSAIPWPDAVAQFDPEPSKENDPGRVDPSDNEYEERLSAMTDGHLMLLWWLYGMLALKLYYSVMVWQYTTGISLHLVSSSDTKCLQFWKE